VSGSFVSGSFVSGSLATALVHHARLLRTDLKPVHAPSRLLRQRRANEVLTPIFNF
jgi:hypothetical protein